MKKLMMIIAAMLCSVALFAAEFETGKKVYVAEETAVFKSSAGPFAKTVTDYNAIVEQLQHKSKPLRFYSISSRTMSAGFFS